MNDMRWSRSTPLLLAVFVLWAYIVSSYVYKTWYVAIAIALVTTAALILKGAIRVDGLPRATAPVALYFCWMLASALWARFPEEVYTWMAIDSIELGVFVLFFLAGCNATADQVISGLSSLVIPSVIIATIMHVFDRGLDPAFTRVAPYAVALLPMIVPFLVWRAKTAPPRWLYQLAIALTFAVLVIGRSRMQLAVGGLMLLMSVVAFRENVRAAFRELLIHGAIIVTTIAALAALPSTRTAVVAIASRYVRADITWGGVHVAAQKRDGVRPGLAVLSTDLLPEAMPLGIGYMNAVGYYKEAAGRPVSLHNMYMTFLLEGGLPCVAIILFLALRHGRALKIYIATAHTAEERGYGKALVLASLGVLPFGAFHQVQQTPTLWMLLGLGAACGVEVRNRRKI
ncbi:MAG TPA: hypothetical protein VGQ76_04710 [Thermoanaerobaculia bacterium]|jgi:hypothetical protein|nr:hypothetical protein [Thermoanaerobaculia bacterium]